MASRSDTDILSARGGESALRLLSTIPKMRYSQWPRKNGCTMAVARAVPRITVVDRDWVAARKGSLAAPHRVKRTTGAFLGVVERPDLHVTLGLDFGGLGTV
jgi:hypothetical protein